MIALNSGEWQAIRTALLMHQLRLDAPAVPLNSSWSKGYGRVDVAYPNGSKIMKGSHQVSLLEREERAITFLPSLGNQQTSIHWNGGRLGKDLSPFDHSSFAVARDRVYEECSLRLAGTAQLSSRHWTLVRVALVVDCRHEEISLKYNHTDVKQGNYRWFSIPVAVDESSVIVLFYTDTHGWRIGRYLFQIDGQEIVCLNYQVEQGRQTLSIPSSSLEEILRDWREIL